ncbi:MAG: YraN family protein [Spirochaetes bacterium]|nr:YraN family protein [Spirochaetota bacterium]
MNTVSKGHKGEQVAAEYVKQKGYTVLEQNYRLKHGEIDLIARDGDTIVFFEIKTWRTYGTDQIHYSIDRVKQGKIFSIAKVYLREHPEYDGNPVRFDVILVQGDGGRIEHYAHAFDEEQ